MGTLHRQPPPGICTRQTSSLRGWARARGQAPRQFFDRTSTKRNGRRRNPRHTRGRAGAGLDSTSFPLRAKARENMEGRVFGGRGSLSIYDLQLAFLP